MTREFIDSEYLRTILIVVPKQNEKEFLETYATLGSDIAGFGGPEWSAANADRLGK